MNENEFKHLLSQKENKDMDFKLELPDAKRVAQLVSAFYNSRGGKIVSGVEMSPESQQGWMMQRRLSINLSRLSGTGAGLIVSLRLSL